MTTSPVAQAERERRVEQALHSGEMEGFSVDGDTLADSDDYIAGVIDADELVARAPGSRKSRSLGL